MLYSSWGHIPIHIYTHVYYNSDYHMLCTPYNIDHSYYYLYTFILVCVIIINGMYTSMYR